MDEMKCEVFFDPQIFCGLRTLLVQALDKLCHVLRGSFQYVLNSKTQFENESWTSIVVCLHDEYAKYSPLLHQPSPPHVVSPLWILSSTLCCRLQALVSSSVYMISARM